MDERTKLVAPCGLDCGVCEMYLSKDDDRIMKLLVSKGIPRQVLPCKGCRSNEGKCPIHPGACATAECAVKMGVSHCSACGEFPCMKLAPAADRAGSLPHNIKMFNLCVIAKHGVEGLVKRSSEVKQAYYRGRIVIGEGPRLDDAE